MVSAPTNQQSRHIWVNFAKYGNKTRHTKLTTQFVFSSPIVYCLLWAVRREPWGLSQTSNVIWFYVAIRQIKNICNVRHSDLCLTGTGNVSNSTRLSLNTQWGQMPDPPDLTVLSSCMHYATIAHTAHLGVHYPPEDVVVVVLDENPQYSKLCLFQPLCDGMRIPTRHCDERLWQKIIFSEFMEQYR